MECPVCFRWGPADPDTGYDADAICPACAAAGWDLTRDGRIVGPADRPDLPRPRMARATIARRRARTAGLVVLCVLLTGCTQEGQPVGPSPPPALTLQMGGCVCVE